MADRHWTDDAAVDAWLEWLHGNRGRKPRTIESYGMSLRKLREYLSNQGVALLDADTSLIEVFCGPHLHKLGVVARSRVPYISAIRGFYAWACHPTRRIIESNPAKHLQHPKHGKPLPETITLGNAEKLMWAHDLSTFVGIRDAAILSLLIGCGPRVSGITALNESDLVPVYLGNVQRMTLRLREKGERERRVPLPREAEMLVRVYLGHEELKAIDRDIEIKEGNGVRRDRVLFVSVRSTKLPPHEHRGERRRLTRKAVNDLLMRCARRAGVPAEQAHPHAMRHLFGTELTESDVSLAATADLMGHADVKSTTVYIHLASRRKAEVIDRAAPLAKMTTPVSELLKRLPPG